MRSFRMFNDVDQVHVEWTILGLRWRMPSMLLFISVLLIAAAVATLVSAWVGLFLGLAMALGVVSMVRMINHMDPAGSLHEFTQLGLVLRTWRRPVINNTGRR